METLKECDYNEYAYELAVNEYLALDVWSILQRYRIIEDRIKLMKTLKECDYNKNVYKVAVNKDMLRERTIEEQIKLMETLKECDYNKYAYELAVDEHILGVYGRISSRVAEEQIKLMRTLKECGYNENAYELAVNSSVLIHRTTEEQIKLMKENKIRHDENIKNISSLTEFKMYLEKLQKELGRDADVNNFTKVLRFKPETKEEK